MVAQQFLHGRAPIRPQRKLPTLTNTALVISLLLASAARVGQAEEYRFGRDVLPILSDRCFHCHGPDATHREADLRLDVEKEAVADREGHAAIMPGKPDDSELIKRVTSSDPDLRMPPADSHRKPLTPRETEVLRQWIASGAKWGRHWAFEKPERVAIADSAANPIDFLVDRRLKLEGFARSPEANKRTLIRRVTFDLTGLPPTLAEVDAFVADASPDAYERLVDRLLASPHFGERMAMWWLDAARYSDTDGFQHDDTRSNWPWRDWVTHAFNDNMPFDEFTIQQFAGDLLPNATPEQILATCFHRNHMTNGEGGRDPEESRIDYVIDRVNTVGTVWLGLTLGCCQCHSHKFDPISQTDYYSLSAFFDSIDETGGAGNKATPYLQYKSPLVGPSVKDAQRLVDARRKREVAGREEATAGFEPWLTNQIAAVRNGFSAWHAFNPRALESAEGSILKQGADGSITAIGHRPKQDDYRLIGGVNVSRVTGLRLEVLPALSIDKEFVLTDVKLQVRRKGKSQLRDIEISSAIADAEKSMKGKKEKDEYGTINTTLDDDPRNGWTVDAPDFAKPHVAVFRLDQPLNLAADEELIFTMLHRSTHVGANIQRFRLLVTDQPGDVMLTLGPLPLEDLATAKVNAPNEISESLRSDLLAQYLADHAEYQSVKRSLGMATRQLDEMKRRAAAVNVMVLKELDKPRHTFVLQRGVWDNKGEEVGHAVPAAVLPWPADQTKTRLDLANWIVSADNPLTSRVIANQLWQICFGAGLVRTPEDFGLQGEAPTNPELLDWLACELVAQKWSVKQVLREIVTSETYRQSSAATPALMERDPENRLLARGARYRLPSWMIRDAALESSGLLNANVGGPPVRPYQPDGVWEEMFMGRFHYEPSQGTAQFRRTLYAFWRRAIAPTFLFDCAQRRNCEVRMQRTNTPLQALTLLNDENQMEAARALAREAIAEKHKPAERIDRMFARVLSRPPSDKERKVLVEELTRTESFYRTAPQEAAKFLQFGQDENQTVERPAELASYTIVASMILNLDEAITHE